jgi:tRNA dimethylallyltransferase
MKIPIITGPTASGKTALAFKLSETYNIEFISADAYQVYKYMNIGTAKPSINELNKVKHHLIDFLEPDNTYSAGDFVGQAETAITDILNRNNLPVIVGGTGLYVESLIKGIFNGPKRNENLRGNLKKIYNKKGLNFLYEYLEKIDFEYADKISNRDYQRIIRAIEVYKLTGLPFSKAQKQLHKHPKFEYELFVLNKDRNKLYKDIDMRVNNMFETGWIKEVEELLNKGFLPDFPSFKAIGYREIIDLINNKINKDECISVIQKKTRNFAKRQLTWFRHMDYAININLDSVTKEIIFTYFKENYQFYLK